MAVVTMKNLLESGVHFGHQTKRWDPRMKQFIFAERNGIHIIDLQKTIAAIREVYEVIRKAVINQKSVLFVGTKKQAQQAIEREAKRCSMFYVNHRWLGGTLSNWATIQRSIQRFKELEEMETPAAALSRQTLSNLSSDPSMTNRPGIGDEASESISISANETDSDENNLSQKDQPVLDEALIS